MVLLPQRFKSGRGPRDCVRNTSPTFSALETGLPPGNCFPRSVAAQETRVLGRPPYRSPLKIPINVYLAPDTTLLPTGFRLKHSACAAQEKLGTCAGSPQHVLWLSSFLLLLPLSLLFSAWLCTSPQTAAKDMVMAPSPLPAKTSEWIASRIKKSCADLERIIPVQLKACRGSPLPPTPAPGPGRLELLQTSRLSSQTPPANTPERSCLLSLLQLQGFGRSIPSPENLLFLVSIPPAHLASEFKCYFFRKVCPNPPQR